MSVLIKNTTMPKNCIECPMQFGGWCYVCDIDERVAETFEEAVKQGKPDWCPLVEIEGDDVAPVVHGRWEVVYNSVGKQVGQCTHCGKNSGILITKKSYCPNCGAKMDESEDKANE